MRAQSDAFARLTVGYEDPSRPIAPDFVGLSYESAILAAGDYFAPDNASVLGLVRLLGAEGVIRIGGNTSERTVWRAAGEPAAAESFVITPAKIDRLAAALRILGWKLVYGLNLARGAPEDAAAEAAYVARAVGANLLAFQIGNEPDGFGRWTAVRPKSYDAPAYLAEWRAFHAAVRARVPDARFAGPDVAAATDWVAAFAAARPAGLVLLTRHYYADGPAGAPHVTLARLLRSRRQLAPVLDELAREGRAYRLPWRIVEANSVYDEGQPGVSDTLGAALWGLELMFAAAASGAAGVNFHAGVHNRRPGDDKAYTPIARAEAGRHRARPLYYGMLMFAQAARGALVPARLAPDIGELAAFAVRAPEGSLRVCLINADFVRGARVRIDPGRRFAVASVMRLSGPSADATAGVTLGGAGVDDFGRWAPATGELAHATARELAVDVPAASAAVVSLRP
ncbi:MAG TPA: glycosyl hydrolase family 79 C-terminal domain-containing protein [Xanthobacteraceae bacterium]